MPKRKIKSKININEADNLSKQYIEKIHNEIAFSLEIDPENKYNMPDDQKQFLAYYIQFRSLNTAAVLANIDIAVAATYLMSYSSQEEIHRINKAIMQKQFSTKLASLDDIGGWLTALLMDDTVEGDKVNSKQKLKIAQMLIDLHKLKAESLDNPGLLINKDVNVDLKDLSIETIKNLIYNSEQLETKNNAINRLKERNDLTYEDIEYLKTLNTNTLLSFVNDLEKEDENNIKKEEKNDAKNN